MKAPPTPDFQIEELTSRNWDRIEDQLIDKLARETLSEAQTGKGRTYLTFAAGGLVLAAAAVLALVVMRGDSRVAELSSSRVATSNAPSRVSVGSSELIVSPNTSLVWSGDDEHGILVVLEAGEVECAVAPRMKRPPFVVQAGDVRVEVVGTRFSVARSGNTARVQVTKGTVRVVASGEVNLVNAGESWPLEKAAAPHAASSMDHESAAEVTPTMDFEDDPVGAGSDVRARGVRAVRRSRAKASADRPSTDAERYRRAVDLEPSDPRTAIELYHEIAKGHGPWAATALFAQARLEFDLGNRSGAGRLLKAYLRRFPSGPNAEDARQLLNDLR